MSIKKFIKSNLVAIVAVFLAIGTMSFKMANAKTTWHYTSNSTAAGEFAKASNWALGTGSCQVSGTKPCQITVDASDQTELDVYLSGKTNAQVLAIDPSRKN